MSWREPEKNRDFKNPVSDREFGIKYTRNRDKAFKEKMKYFDFLSVVMAKKNDYGRGSKIRESP